MTWDAVLWSILLSLVSSYFFWIMSFVFSSAKVIFSSVIEKSMVESYDDGDALYRIRIMNIGRRDLIEINYSAKILIEMDYMGRKSKQACYFSLENDQTRPEMKGRGKKAGDRYYRSHTCLFAMNDAARAEYLKPFYSDYIRQEAQQNTLSLDDLFREYGDKVKITIYVAGTDRTTGSRRLFTSGEYTQKNIQLGKYKSWFAGMGKKIPKHTLRRKSKMTQAISQFETIDEYIDSTGIDPLEALKNTNSEAKNVFLADPGMEKPDNVYGNIDISEISEKKRKLEEPLDYIEKTGVIRKDMAPYLCLMNYNLHKLKIVEACHDYLHTGSAARKAEIAMKHREENNALYDIPDPETYRAAVASVLSGSTASFYQPSEEVRSRFEKIIGSHLKEILSVIPEKDSYTTDEVCSMMNLALAKVPNAVSLGWKAVVNKTAAYASVDLIDRKVIVPGSRSCGAYTWQSVRTTVAHEIGTHVFRAAGLGDCPCTALQKGLPGYDSFEEGLASIVEQSVSHNYTHPGIRHYISVGLAFIDGLNFRDTYNRLLEIYGRNRLSESLAFDSVQRAFRGTGELVYTKDLAYFNGYDRVWKFIEEHIDDESLTDLLFRSGKTDPTNEAHMNILEHCSREAVRSGTVA